MVISMSETKEEKSKIESKIIDELIESLHTRNITKLGKFEFMLWISWLDQRSGFREFRIVTVDENFKVLCTYGTRVIVDGKEFINSIAAIELTEKLFISADSATKDDWRAFIDRIVDNEKPRVIPNYSFRKRLAMPESASLFEVYVLSIDVRESE